MRKILTLLSIVAATVAVAAQVPKNPQKPGKWKVSMETEMPGMPMKMPAVTTEVCLTEEDIADPQKNVPKDQKSTCTISDYKVTGNTVTYTMTCPEQATKASAEFTYGADAYSGVLKMKMGEREMTQKHTGKWLGACTK